MSDPKYVKRNYLSERKPGSLGGVEALIRNNNYKKRSDIQHALRDLRTFLVHRPTKTKFRRRFYKCPYQNYLWALDLADYQKYSRTNNGIRFLLVGVDCLSRFIMVVKLRNKTSEETAKAIEIMFKERRQTPERILVDRGNEFWGGPTKEFLKKNGVKLIANYSPLKASLVETQIKTLKNKISHYQTKTKSTRYVDALNDIVYSINNSFNNTIQGVPAKMKNTAKDNDHLWHNVYNKFITQKPEKIRFAVGDLVLVSSKRLRHNKSVFIKGYVQRFEPVVYKISEIIKQFPVPFIRLMTTGKIPEELPGMFYQAELTKTNKEKLDDE